MTHYKMRKIGSVLRTQQYVQSDKIEKREIICSCAKYQIPLYTSIGVELNSIIGNMEQSPLSLCSSTSQINVISMETREGSDEPRQQQESNNTSFFSHINNTTFSSIWILETLDEHGAKKVVGGDEFVVNYNYYHPGDKSKIAYTARTMTTDNHDGTYCTC